MSDKRDKPPAGSVPAGSTRGEQAGLGDTASSEVPDWLGSQLRELYADVMNEPLPDQFRKLLDQLEDKGDD
jgi:Anti-sigma factor NepR